MRYEQMTIEQQETVLVRLNNRLNKQLFNNELSCLPIWIVEKIDWVCDDGECYACYSAAKQRFYFSEVIAEDIKTLTKEKQKLFLSAIMIHEMVHQYCHENHIDDINHGQSWESAAHSHGLEGSYLNGTERLSLLGFLAVQNFKF